MPGKERIDPITEEIYSRSRGPGLNLDISLKVKCIKLIIAIYNFVEGIITKGAPTIRPIEQQWYAQLQIGGLIYSAYQACRQSANGVGSILDKTRGKSVKVTLANQTGTVAVTIDNDVVQSQLASIAKELGIPFSKATGTDLKHWYGTMNPLITILTAASSRLREIRMGTSLTGTDKQNVMVECHKWGIPMSLGPINTGALMTPSQRSSIAQSMGIGIQLIMLSHTTGKFGGKWINAVERSLNYIPGIRDICTFINTTEKKKKPPLNTLLASIATIGSSREQHKVFPTIGQYKRAWDSLKQYGEEAATQLLDFSGKGAAYIYATNAKVKWIMPCGNGMQERLQQQLYFHVYWGTHTESKEVLSKITGEAAWANRADFADSFLSMGQSTTHREVAPVKLIWYSKLSNAKQTQYGNQIIADAPCHPVFAGMRIQKFSDKFLNNLESTSTVNQSKLDNFEDIKSYLQDYLNNLLIWVRGRGGRVEWGATNWFWVDRLKVIKTEDSVKWDVGEEIAEEIPSGSSFFYEQDPNSDAPRALKRKADDAQLDQGLSFKRAGTSSESMDI
uniref:Nucleocapsid protein n=1 Tax=Neotermes castaneus orthomyxovirus 1 TaxID=3133494 RepID=A0AAT9JNB6_9ORTO